ncbi:DUF4124 domain-containing protein [Salinivibrio sp. ES.052]|uniref:DUF4124 domain-containing protein n=1 Tax=Salinivibrio sp. ES.052 TaxID=1882823 RepID=UPI0009289366|nr:DUF4124 domain-containing protein [Salinivibrio sp. ES.052]SIO24103.1 protein of unknown function [Salinivibrio sp. ES.052]
MRWLWVLWLGITLICQAGTFYQWTDKNGNVHFSDQLPSQAHQIRHYSISAPTQPSTSVSSPLAKATHSAPIPSTSTPTPVAITLIHPKQGATLRSNPGTLFVTAKLSPRSVIASQVQLLFDNEPVARSPVKTVKAAHQQLQWSLGPIDRGTHQLQVQYLENGKVIASTPIYQVYLHRAHVNQPHRLQKTSQQR